MCVYLKRESFENNKMLADKEQVGEVRVCGRKASLMGWYSVHTREREVEQMLN